MYKCDVVDGAVYLGEYGDGRWCNPPYVRPASLYIYVGQTEIVPVCQFGPDGSDYSSGVSPHNPGLVEAMRRAVERGLVTKAQLDEQLKGMGYLCGTPLPDVFGGDE